MKTALCVFSLNAEKVAQPFSDALSAQLYAVDKKLLIDSSSSDRTKEIFASAGFHVHSIPRASFNHGGTRQLALEQCSRAEVLVCMSQDALLATPSSLTHLLAAFSDSEVGAVFGRQLPRESADPIEAHARLFNYPPVSIKKSPTDIPLLGIKTAFISNSFAAYRCSALKEVGGFPGNVIVSEDTYVAAKMLLDGWKIQYCADAEVHHSHNYSITQEFQRYFDVGVFHSRQPWIRETFGQAEGEGKRFVRSELAYLWKENYLLIPSALLRTVLKYLSFRLGLCESFLPNKLKLWFSMQRHFWVRERDSRC